MRIAFVAAGGFDRSGRDVTPVLVSLVERLARRHEVHVLVLDYATAPDTYPFGDATVHDLGRVTGPRGFRRHRIGRRLARAIDALGPFDLLHAFLGMPAGVASVGAARRRALPTVVTLSSGECVRIDDIEYGLQRRWIDRRAVARMLQGATAVTVPTSYMARLVAACGVRRPPPAIIPIGIDTSRFAAAPPPDGPPWRLVRIGSVNRVKDYTTLLHAMAVLPSTVTLDIAGVDTLGGAMARLAADLGIQERVTFHGWLPTDRVAQLLTRAHLHVVSSRHEAANVAMLEAAASGVATVGTAVGHVADWAPHAAVAVAVGDPSAMAAAIADLLAHPERRAAIASAARQWTRAHDADWTAAAFDDLYHRVTKR